MTKLTFKDKVFSIVSKIPAGQVMTYGQVAAKAGNPKAARAVGAALRTNFAPEIPCHRVVAANGALTGYNRGLDQKAALLKKEGATAALEKISAAFKKSSKRRPGRKPPHSRHPNQQAFPDIKDQTA